MGSPVADVVGDFLLRNFCHRDRSSLAGYGVLAIDGEAHSGDDLMCAAREEMQHAGGIGWVRGLAEDLIVDDYDCVGAEHRVVRVLLSRWLAPSRGLIARRSLWPRSFGSGSSLMWAGWTSKGMWRCGGVHGGEERRRLARAYGYCTGVGQALAIRSARNSLSLVDLLRVL